MIKPTVTHSPVRGGAFQHLHCPNCPRDLWVQQPLRQSICQACGWKLEVRETREEPPNGTD